MRRKRKHKPTIPENCLCLKKKLPAYGNRELLERINDRIHNAQDRQMFCWKLIDGLTLEQVAEKQNRPLSTVRDHYYQQISTIFPEYPDL